MSVETMETIRVLAKFLSPGQQLMLIGELVANVRSTLEPVEKTPSRSIRGALKDFKPSPSAEDIDEARREAWAVSPREG